jgi:hypothetical protein
MNQVLSLYSKKRIVVWDTALFLHRAKSEWGYLFGCSCKDPCKQKQYVSEKGGTISLSSACTFSFFAVHLLSFFQDSVP